MKILFISEYYPPFIKGGSEVSTSLLAKWLAKNHTVTVITSRLNKRAWIEDGVMAYPLIQMANVGKKGFYSAILYATGIIILPIITAWKILRFSQNEKPNIVQVVPSSYQFIPAILMLRLIARLPVVIDCRDYSLICPTNLSNEKFNDAAKIKHGYQCLLDYEPSNKLLSIFRYPFAIYESFIFNTNKYLLRFFTNHFSDLKLVAISRYVQEQLLKNGFRTDTVSVINNIAPAKKEMKLAASDSSYFVYAGRIEKAKGIWDLISASETLHQRGYEFILKIAGTGNDSKKLSLYLESKKMTYISLLGKIKPDDVIDLYARAKAIIAPSRWPEPFGRFGLEAMSTGTPVIATRTGGIPEGIDERVTGILIEVGDINELASAMETFLLNPAQGVSMRPAILKKSLSYSPEVIGSARLNLYNRLLKKS